MNWAILLYHQESDYHGMDIQENAIQNLVGTKDISSPNYPDQL